jgi:hypothetical protein
MVQEMIMEHDEPILQKLTDVTVTFTEKPMVSGNLLHESALAALFWDNFFFKTPKPFTLAGIESHSLSYCFLPSIFFSKKSESFALAGQQDLLFCLNQTLDESCVLRAILNFTPGSQG